MKRSIDALKQQLAEVARDASAQRKSIEKQLYKALSLAWNDWGALQKALVNAESATEFSWNKYGEVVRWFRFAGLAEIEDDERELFGLYVAENHCMSVDWENDVFEMGENDCLFYDDEEQSINLLRKSIFKVDPENLIEAYEAIEKWMEKEGYYPNVLLATRHGDLMLWKSYYAWLEGKNHG